MQQPENSVAELASIGNSEPSTQVEPHPAATVLALVRKRRGAPARERPPIEFSRVSGPQQRLGPPPLTEIFLGSVETARARARQVINEVPPPGCIRIVEGWRQLADGQVQFTIRRLPTRASAGRLVL
jgi:hypothetical protein